jgi:hypothetical protein
MKKSMEEIKATLTKLEEVVKELQEIGCHGSIVMRETAPNGEERPTELLISNKDMPEGKAYYKKSVSGGYWNIEKNVKVGNVVFTTYISKKEAEKELFA